MTGIVTLHDAAPDAAAVETDRAGAAAACEAELAARGLSRSRAAREIGISGPRLGRWLAGTYTGDVPGTTGAVKTWLATLREGDERGIAGAGLDRHAALAVTADIQAALAHAQATGDVVMVAGPSGAGKSWASQRYCTTRSAALWLEVDGAVVTHAGLLGLVAEAAGAGPQHSSALAARKAAVTALTDRGALLVVDEAHHLSAALIDELRRVRDMSGAGLALVGDEALRMTVARCPQVTGRIGMRVGLRASAEADVRMLGQGVLGRRPDRAEMKTLMAAARGPGGLHALRRLLMRAWMIARAEGIGEIGPEDIAAAAGEAV